MCRHRPIHPPTPNPLRCFNPSPALAARRTRTPAPPTCVPTLTLAHIHARVRAPTPTQVEAFFLEALDSVKQAIRSRNLASKRATQSLRAMATAGAGGTGTLKFPAIRDGSGSPTAHGTGDDERVELKDLTLEVRCAGGWG